MVPKVRLELTRLATEAFEAPVSAIPPLGLDWRGRDSNPRTPGYEPVEEPLLHPAI